MLFAEYGDDGPTVIELLAGLARDLVARLEHDPGDADAFDDAAEVIQALRELGGDCEEVETFKAITERRRNARTAARRSSRPVAPWEGVKSGSSAVAAAVRPGRNDVCWCGSNRKYKKCHLDSDDEALRSS
jgi:hypothetical protein